MEKILAFDCSSQYLHVYLKNKEKEYIEIRNVGLKHSELLLPLIDSILMEAKLKPTELDLIACTRGPGSFTGLRIAMATAKGISSGAGIPLISLITTDYLAYKCDPTTITIPMIDAKKKRYYCQIYENNKSISDPLDLSAENLMNKIIELNPLKKKIIITGPDGNMGFMELSEILQKSNIKDLQLQLDPLYNISRITNLANLAEKEFKANGADIESIGPVYIRKSDAEETILKKNKANYL